MIPFLSGSDPTPRDEVTMKAGKRIGKVARTCTSVIYITAMAYSTICNATLSQDATSSNALTLNLPVVHDGYASKITNRIPDESLDEVMKKGWERVCLSIAMDGYDVNALLEEGGRKINEWSKSNGEINLLNMEDEV